MNAVTVHPEWAKQNPETVRKVIRALLRGNAWIIDNTAEAAVPSMKPFLGGLDDKILIAGLSKVRLGVPRDGRITERAVTLTQEFLKKIGHLKAPIPYAELVTNDYLPK
jgi:ABC-type nitrate/sulfonate/bicarbonate transport system substrate-binding protein